MRLRIALCVWLFAALVAVASDRNWQNGKVLASERQQICPRGYDCVFQDFLIAAATRTYTAREKLKYRWSKEANVTVNAPVRFAVDPRERKMWIIDADGKQHEMEIIKRELRASE